MSVKYIALFGILLIVVIIVSRKKKTNLHYTFPSVDVVHQTIQKARATFFEKLSADDLSARNVKTKELYLQRYSNSIQPLSSNEKKFIERLLSEIEIGLKKQNNTISQTVLKSKWSIVKHTDPTVEGGYPHTLGQMVFLPADFFDESNLEARKQTLLHEQIHVLQRQNPDFVSQFIKDYFPAPRKHRSEFENQVSLRLNPDLDEYIYGFPSPDRKTVHYIAQVYTKTNPSSLSQSKPVFISQTTTTAFHSKNTDRLLSSVEQTEHPFEVMACHYSKLL